MKIFHRHLAPQTVSEIVDSIKLESLLIPEVNIEWPDRDKSDYIANLFKNYPQVFMRLQALLLGVVVL